MVEDVVLLGDAGQELAGGETSLRYATTRT